MGYSIKKINNKLNLLAYWRFHSNALQTAQWTDKFQLEFQNIKDETINIFPSVDSNFHPNFCIKNN